MPYIFPNGNVNTDYFTDNNASGGSGSVPFTFIKMDGAILTKINAWKETWRIRGVEVFMSDGSSYLAGTRSGTLEEFTFQSGEFINCLNIQASGELSSGGYRRFGALYFNTNKNSEFGIYSDKLQDDGAYWPDVGCGICCGIFGASGDDVDRLGFAMLRNVKESTLMNVEYPNLSLEIVSNTPDSVVKQTFINGTSINQVFEHRQERSISVTNFWSLSNALSMTVSMKVTAGVPLVLSVETDYSWTVGSTSTHELSETTTETATSTWPITCEAGRKVEGSSTSFADNIETPYKADVELILENNKVFKYTEKGIYRGLSVRSGYTSVVDLGPATI